MFSELLESAPRTERSIGGTIASVIFHSAAIAATIFGTLHATERRDTPKVARLVFTAPAPNAPPVRRAAATPDAGGSILPPREFVVPGQLLEIPGTLPTVDISAAVTDAVAFGGTGAPGAVADTRDGTAPGDGTPWFEFQVEKPVILAPGSPAPQYPGILRSGGVEGEVLCAFRGRYGGPGRPWHLQGARTLP